jgi:hypothetical protein
MKKILFILLVGLVLPQFSYAQVLDASGLTSKQMDSLRKQIIKMQQKNRVVHNNEATPNENPSWVSAASQMIRQHGSMPEHNETSDAFHKIQDHTPATDAFRQTDHTETSDAFSSNPSRVNVGIESVMDLTMNQFNDLNNEAKKMREEKNEDTSIPFLESGVNLSKEDEGEREIKVNTAGLSPEQIKYFATKIETLTKENKAH